MLSCSGLWLATRSCSRVFVFLLRKTSERPLIVACIGAAFLTDIEVDGGMVPSRGPRIPVSPSRQSRTDTRLNAISLYLYVASHEASRVFSSTKDLHRVDGKRLCRAADSTAFVSVILILNHYYDSISHRLLFRHEVSSETECGTQEPHASS